MIQEIFAENLTGLPIDSHFKQYIPGTSSLLTALLRLVGIVTSYFAKMQAIESTYIRVKRSKAHDLQAVFHSVLYAMRFKFARV